MSFGQISEFNKAAPVVRNSRTVSDAYCSQLMLGSELTFFAFNFFMRTYLNRSSFFSRLRVFSLLNLFFAYLFIHFLLLLAPFCTKDLLFLSLSYIFFCSLKKNTNKEIINK